MDRPKIEHLKEIYSLNPRLHETKLELIEYIEQLESEIKDLKENVFNKFSDKIKGVMF